MIEKNTGRTLTPRQRAFVQAVSNPADGRSIAEKARGAGYTDLYGYRLARRPHVAAAIEQETREHVQLMRARVARVLSVLADSAEAGDVKAAALFLEAAGVIGGRGTSVTVSATAVADPELTEEARAERIRRARALRGGPRFAEGVFHGGKPD